MKNAKSSQTYKNLYMLRYCTYKAQKYAQSQNSVARPQHLETLFCSSGGLNYRYCPVLKTVRLIISMKVFDT